MIDSNVARRYARAVLELGTEAGTLDAMVRELGDVAKAYAGSEEMRQAFENPLVAIDAKQRCALFDGTADVDEDLE